MSEKFQFSRPKPPEKESDEEIIADVLKATANSVEAPKPPSTPDKTSVVFGDENLHPVPNDEENQKKFDEGKNPHGFKPLQ